MSPRRRSTRSHLVEFALAAVAVLVIYLFLTQGGPDAFGHFFAGQMHVGN